MKNLNLYIIAVFLAMVLTIPVMVYAQPPGLPPGSLLGDLQNQINAEEAARIEGDQNLQNQINTIELIPGPQGPAGPPGPKGDSGIDPEFIDLLCDLYAQTGKSLPEVCSVKLVFLTSSLHNGNLGGVSGADAICQNLATNAGLAGNYMAWLSDSSGNSPSTRFAKSDVPYILVDRTAIALDWDDLTDKSLLHTIDLTEQGNYVDIASVWGSRWDGTSGSTAPTDFCLDYTYSQYTFGDIIAGVGMNNKTDWYWSGGGIGTCDATYHLYCFQQ
ncbi:MAG: hypothetical protein JSW20_14660 [Nitrospiraceae bacterium]|nr:MAG: hypothetical protein JSW20_14660 [Nitrospiraceae bacterium]